MPVSAWARASSGIWWPSPSVDRSPSRWSLHRSTCGGFLLPAIRMNWCVTTACASRFAGTGVIFKWEFQVDGRLVEYEVKGNLTISDTLFSVDAALEGVGLAYTFEQLALPHIRAKRLKRVLTSFSPTFPGFYLYYPSRRNQPTKLKALIEYAKRRAR